MGGRSGNFGPQDYAKNELIIFIDKFEHMAKFQLNYFQNGLFPVKSSYNTRLFIKYFPENI